MNIQKILVPIDFSECSKTATLFSFELAIKLDARLYLMHSMDNIFSMPLEEFKEELTKNERFQQVKVKTITEVGDPDLSILTEAQVLDADLIVMGSKGSSGGKKLLGSTTTRVVSKSNIPVLAIPQNNSYADFEDMVFMTDFKEGDLSALLEISHWARYFNANLHVLHIFTDDSLEELIKFRGFKEVAREQVVYEKLFFERIFNSSFEEGFFNYLKTRNSNLFILPRYKKAPFQKLIKKDHARQIEFESNIPFLSLPAEKFIGKEQQHNTLKQ
ncbi:universal stress protein [Aliifodinibius salicampi]|uniref:Universal stress protein n=1 Tax=Fodinibius salicampi TaxID=1920655 RepID=A0ABT3PUA1_9BACT|nr:universal stress protein [Fodinibius salicampi]MCW9711424.1 universal stress protein [Fodinibius salicampi]